MGLIDSTKETLWGIVTTFRTPRFMDVVDLRLGAANLGLQIAILTYFIIVMVSFKEYETKYTPDGSAQYFMSAGAIEEIQQSAATKALCADTSKYDYSDPDCDNKEYFWCENNIMCSYPSLAEASKKTDASIWAYTYLKDAHYIRAPTDSGFNCATDYEKTEVGGVTKCVKYQNTFMTGTEGARLMFASSFYIPELNKREINVVTRIRKQGFANIHGVDDSDELVFDDRKNIEVKLTDLLKIAGIEDLNAPNLEAMEQYPSKNPNEIAPYRQTGYTLQLDFTWLGSVGSTIPNDSNVELIVSVIGNAGYASKGNDVVFVDYPETIGDVYGAKADYHDRYYRGIKVTFNYGGTIGHFDWYNLVVIFTSFTVLLSLSGTIVSLVAYYALGYSSKVYANFGQQKVHIKRLHGKIAAQALIAGAVWNNILNLKANQSPGFDHFVEAFMKQGYNTEDASYLAKALLTTTHEDEDEGLKALQESMNDATSGLTAISKMPSLGSANKLTFGLLGVSQRNLDTSDVEEAEESLQEADGPEPEPEREPEPVDPFAAARHETIDMAQFCDLISEEETNIRDVMQNLGGGELELGEDLDDDEPVKTGGIELVPIQESNDGSSDEGETPFQDSNRVATEV